MRISLDLIKPKQDRIQGFVFYEGPSQINGKKIVGIATGLNRNSGNSKTGDMVQTYILPWQKPTKAVFNGDDESVCGDCLHRYNKAGSCYVNAGHGPLAVWRAWKRGNYKPEKSSLLLAGRKVRLGAYGDPVAIPFKIWQELLLDSAGWTGYTHQWRRKYAQPFRKYLMASCELPEHRILAQQKGWRTFRIRLNSDDGLMKGEFECPASQEQGKRLTCEDCMACGGGGRDKASPAIIVHGTNWKVMAFKQYITTLEV